jgi:hypothetical protein
LEYLMVTCGSLKVSSLLFIFFLCSLGCANSVNLCPLSVSPHHYFYTLPASFHFISYTFHLWNVHLVLLKEYHILCLILSVGEDTAQCLPHLNLF